MSRRVSADAAAAAAAAAAEAAKAASDAGRTLQQRGQELKVQPQLQPKEEKAQRPEPPAQKRDDEPADPLTSERIAKLQDNNPSNKLREEFAERTLKEYEKTTVAPEAEKQAEEPKAEEPKAAEPSKEQPAEAPAAPQEALRQPEPIKTVRVKVDGEEYDAPAEEVEAAGGVKLYQIQKASEKRLKIATDTLAEVKRLASIQPQPQPQKPAEPQPSDEEFIASKMDTLKFGTPQESAAALRDILMRTNKQLDPNALTEQAVNRMKHDMAVADFDREFGDLVKNPMLLDLIYVQRNKRVQQHVAEKKPIDWKNLYTTIGHEVRNLIGRPSQPASVPAATPGHTSQPSEKEARKASIVNLPAAAARVEAPKEQKEPSREDIVNEMKKSRMVWRE